MYGTDLQVSRSYDAHSSVREFGRSNAIDFNPMFSSPINEAAMNFAWIEGCCHVCLIVLNERVFESEWTNDIHADTP